jgi:cobalt-zinc-cadmium efflux system outer membrane protein
MVEPNGMRVTTWEEGTQRPLGRQRRAKTREANVPVRLPDGTTVLETDWQSVLAAGVRCVDLQLETWPADCVGRTRRRRWEQGVDEVLMRPGQCRDRAAASQRPRGLGQKRLMIRAGLWLGALLFAASTTSPVSAQDAPVSAASSVTLDDAVHEAIQHNLSLLAERFNVQVADAAVLTASLKPNPVMTVNLFRPDRALIDAGISPYEEVFRTDYVLERGGKRERRIDQANLAKSVAELQLLNTTRVLILDVQNAFVDVQLAKLNLALARENLQAFDRVVAINTERVRVGDLSPLELSRSRVAALQFQNDVRQQETKLRTARLRLSALIGRVPADETLDTIGDLCRDALPVAIQAIRTAALDRRPDLRAARTDQARSTADLRLQLANGVIDYTVSGEYHRQQGAEVSGNSYGVFVSMPLPFFNRNQGEIARAQAQQQQLKTRVQMLEADIGAEISAAYAQYAASRQIVDTIEGQMLAQAQDVRTTTEYSYRAGEASFIEFLDALRAFNDTMQSYNGARADYARSLFALDAIAGSVNP